MRTDAGVDALRHRGERRGRHHQRRTKTKRHLGKTGRLQPEDAHQIRVVRQRAQASAHLRAREKQIEAKEQRQRDANGDAGNRCHKQTWRNFYRARQLHRHGLKAASEHRADQILHNDLHAERGNEDGEKRAFVALDRPVNAALHEHTKRHHHRHRQQHAGCPVPFKRGDTPPKQIARERECRAVRDMKHLGRAEDEREADRSERVDRAQLQAIDKQL